MGRLRTTPYATIALAVFLVGSVGIATAHEIGASRFAAPIPLSLLYVGAGATVGLTALWLGTADTAIDTLDAPRQITTIGPKTAARLRWAARLSFLALFVTALAAGLAGRQTPENPATVFVWPVWLRGVALLAALAGSPWRVLSPWQTLYDLLARIEGGEFALLGPYPRWLGTWPALVGVVAGVGILGNLTEVPRSPRLTAVVVAGYALVMLGGAVAFGPVWFRRADALAVLYRLFGRVSPLRFERKTEGGYHLHLRPPWTGCVGGVGRVATVAIVVAAVFTVSFDGVSNTNLYQTLLFETRDVLGGPAVGVPLYLLGLAGFVAAYLSVSAVVERLGSDSTREWTATARAFAPTLLPIAVAYEVAHTYPFVVGGVSLLAGDLFSLVGVGPTDPSVLGWLSLPAFWASQVVLVTAGHVVAVVAAHRVAADRYPTRRDALRAHLPLVVLMVGYTVLSLWIISLPVVVP